MRLQKHKKTFFISIVVVVAFLVGVITSYFYLNNHVEKQEIVLSYEEYFERKHQTETKERFVANELDKYPELDEVLLKSEDFTVIEEKFNNENMWFVNVLSKNHEQDPSEARNVYLFVRFECLQCVWAYGG